MANHEILCTSAARRAAFGYMDHRTWCTKARRVVVKVGTSTLTGGGREPNRSRLSAIAADVAAVHRQGREVVLVSSGAIATGAAHVGLSLPVRGISLRQALAAIGQPILMAAYGRAFAKFGIPIAQVLLTREDVEDRRRYLNARNTLLTLLRRRVLPIVNENDAVATEEIQIGDNDNLSALVASLIDADLLVILSDVDGLYNDDPRRNPKASLIPLVERIDKAIEQLAHKTRSPIGVGGMLTKIQAARIGTESAVAVVIVNGDTSQPVQRVLAGEPLGTLFLPTGRRLASRRRWLAFGATPRGTVIVDPGAVAALHRGKSLLPSGIKEVLGDFQSGDLVVIADLEGREVARGLVNYSKAELERIKGLRTSQIEAFLGYKGHEEAVHRDNMVVHRSLMEERGGGNSARSR